MAAAAAEEPGGREGGTCPQPAATGNLTVHRILCTGPLVKANISEQPEKRNAGGGLEEFQAQEPEVCYLPGTGCVHQLEALQTCESGFYGGAIAQAGPRPPVITPPSASPLSRSRGWG